MRLLHVVPTYLPATRYGGPIVAVHALCRALAARGHEVEVFTTSIDGPKNSDVPHGVPVLRDGVKVRYFASRIGRRLAWSPALARQFRDEMKGADIVHLHSVFLWPTATAAHLARRAHVPYLVSPRGMLVRQLIEQRHRLIKSAWIALIEKSNLERAAAIHVTSSREAAELGEFNWRLRRIVTVPNGVDETDPMPAGELSEDIKALAREQPFILFFGRISWVKGLDRLLRAFARTTVGTLAIVGNDYDGLAPKLERMAHDLNIGRRVHFVPRSVTGADREFVFASARAFVLPSYSESFGNVVLEAMQRSLPVVVTSEVGAAEIVQEADGGIVVEGDATALGEAIERLMQNPTLARTMGEAGRRHVRDHYGWAGMAARMEAVYQSLRN